MTKLGEIVSQGDQDSERLVSLSKEINELSEEIPTTAIVDIIATAETIDEYIRREWRRSNSTQAKCRILNVLATQGGSLRLTDLSKKVFRTKFAVKRAVDNLVRDGLVKRELIDDGGRAKQITITKKGVQLIEGTMDLRRSMSKEITAALSTKELVQLSKLLRKTRKHVRRLIS
jgi:DNA-binding MarR family transcriptional regulator